MVKFDPLVGEYYLRGDSVYKVTLVSSSKDTILMADISDNKSYSVEFSLFRFGGYKRVWKTGAVAELLNRSPRSIYLYESDGRIQKPERYTDAYGRSLRFYTKEDILEIQSLICEIHGGRPRKDKKIVSNGVPSRRELLTTFRERFGT